MSELVRRKMGRPAAEEQYVELLEDLSRPYWRRESRLRYVGQWPVGDSNANPNIGGERKLADVQWFRGLRDDFKRKRVFYAQDWVDGFRASGKSLAAVSFLYFACLAPVVAFGGALQLVTQGSLGIIECIISRGVCGMAYAVLAGQPMTFIGPTGLTLTFTTALCAWAASRLMNRRRVV